MIMKPRPPKKPIPQAARSGPKPPPRKPVIPIRKDALFESLRKELGL
jgi:hypothetical protein